jgi:hypothetical protein
VSTKLIDRTLPAATLSQLVIDTDKDWAGKLIKNLGAPVDSGDAARKGDIPLTLKKVAEVSVTSAVTQITITGLDINADKFYLMLLWLKNPTAAAVTYKLYFEGDLTDANYYTQVLYATGTTVGGSRDNSPNLIYINAGYCGIAFVYIFRDVDGVPRFTCDHSHEPASSIFQEHKYCAKTAAVANITRLDLVASAAGGIGAGSKLIIYGAVG